MRLYQYSLFLGEISYGENECLANPQPNFVKSAFNDPSARVTLLGICLLRFFYGRLADRNQTRGFAWRQRVGPSSSIHACHRSELVCTPF